ITLTICLTSGSWQNKAFVSGKACYEPTRLLGQHSLTEIALCECNSIERLHHHLKNKHWQNKAFISGEAFYDTTTLLG
ncbi:hypothetical protein SFRURICE_008890, partial [Spodoptera frugiperda]